MDGLNIRLNKSKEKNNEPEYNWVIDPKYGSQRQGDRIYNEIKIERHRTWWECLIYAYFRYKKEVIKRMRKR